MIIASIKARNDLAILRAKRELYDRFGLEVDIQVKSERYYNDIEQTMDDLSILKAILNRNIPEALRERMSDISCKCRKREMVDLKTIYCKVARDKGLTYTEISHHLNYREHTAVIYLVELADILIRTNSDFKDMYNNILSIYEETIEIVRNGRATEDTCPKSNNTQSTSIVTLYPREPESREYNPNSECRSVDMSEPALVEYREPVTA